MRNDVIVMNISSRNKGHLKRGNKVRKQRLESVCNNFRNNFISNIAKTNRPKLINMSSFLGFGNQGNEGVVKGLKQETMGEEVLHSKDQSSSGNFPKRFVKNGRQTIRARAFKRGK